MIALLRVGLLLLAAVATTATAQGISPTYALTPLGDFQPTGVNRARWVTGYDSRALLWRPGIGIVELGGCPGPGACSNRATAINDAGWSSGFVYDAGFAAYRARRFEGTLPIDMGDIEGGGHTSRAYAINARGWVAGQGGGQYDNHPRYGFLSYNHAMRSKVPGAPAADLGDFEGGLLSSVAYGINGCGAAAGVASVDGGWTAAYWPGEGAFESIVDLGAMWGVSGSGAESFAWDVNNLDQVALELPRTASAESTAAVWSPYSSFTEIGRLPGHTRAAARAINDASLVVGVSSWGSTSRGFAWTATDGLVDLTSRLDPVLGAGWTILEASAVSENGHIVGRAARPGVSGVAVLLSPVQCAGFLDVPASDPFCASVEWMKARNITLGCGNGNYCPAADVIRLSMAAFMRRLGDTMSGHAIVEAAAPGALDFASSPVVCTTDVIPPSAAPRAAVLDAVFAGRASTAGQGLARIVASQDDGVSWQAVHEHDAPATFRADAWRSVRGVAVYDMPPHHRLRFGIRMEREPPSGVSGVADSTCRLRVRVSNRAEPAPL